MKSHKLYFAYGANTNPHDMKIRCPDAQAIGKFTLRNHTLVFRAVADIEFSVDKSVTGMLWAITDDCEQSLDIFEGYPRFYIKSYFDILYRKEIAPVMFYQMNQRSWYEPPGYYYEACLREGYSHWNIDHSQLDCAIEHARTVSV